MQNTYEKEALALYIPSHSVHPPNTARGLSFSLLKNYNANNSNKTNFFAQVNTLFNDLLARCYTKKRIMEMFEEAEIKMMGKNERKTNNKNMGHKLTLEKVI